MGCPSPKLDGGLNADSNKERFEQSVRVAGIHFQNQFKNLNALYL